jgi:protein AroM
MPCLGIVTIGQSPRADLVPELRRWLGDADIAERGALDKLSAADAQCLGPAGPDDRLLVSRMRDGTSVRLGASRIHPLVCEAVREVEDQGAAATLIVCTGELPPIPHRGTLLLAEALLAHGVAAITAGARLGVLCPDQGQSAGTRARWGSMSDDPLVASAPPYAPDALANVSAAAAVLRGAGARFLVLDCAGYDLAARQAAARASGLPALLAREVVAHLAAAALAAEGARTEGGRQ